MGLEIDSPTKLNQNAQVADSFFVHLDAKLPSVMQCPKHPFLTNPGCSDPIHRRIVAPFQDSWASPLAMFSKISKLTSIKFQINVQMNIYLFFITLN